MLQGKSQGKSLNVIKVMLITMEQIAELIARKICNERLQNKFSEICCKTCIENCNENRKNCNEFIPLLLNHRDYLQFVAKVP